MNVPFYPQQPYGAAPQPWGYGQNAAGDARGFPPAGIYQDVVGGPLNLGGFHNPGGFPNQDGAMNVNGGGIPNPVPQPTADKPAATRAAN